MFDMQFKEATQFKGDYGHVSTIDFKALTEEGEFEGYAAIFGNIDGGNDIIQPAALDQTLREKSVSKIKMLMHHDPRRPVGVWDQIFTDNRGLYVKGHLLLKTDDGRNAYEFLKAGAMDGMSIGYRTKEATRDDETFIRTIHRLELFEVSLVTFPMNADTVITGVKSANEIKTIRDFEKHLQDVGFSNNAAKAIAKSGYKSKSDLRDVVDAVGIEQSKALNALTQKLLGA